MHPFISGRPNQTSPQRDHGQSAEQKLGPVKGAIALPGMSQGGRLADSLKTGFSQSKNDFSADAQSDSQAGTLAPLFGPMPDPDLGGSPMPELRLPKPA